MEVGQSINYYKKWKTQTGKAQKVLLVEFLRYYKINSSYYYFKEEGRTYEGQIWKCRIGKKYIECTFKVEVFDYSDMGKTKETSLLDNDKPLLDSSPNPIIDTWQECTLNIINKDLFPSDKKRYRSILQELFEDSTYISVIFLRLNLLHVRDKDTLLDLYSKYLQLNNTLKLKVKRLIQKKMK